MIDPALIKFETVRQIFCNLNQLSQLHSGFILEHMTPDNLLSA